MIRLSSTAEADLSGIDEYLTDVAGLVTAGRVVERILSSIEHLDRFPLMGRVGRMVGTRELIVARLPYIVVYVVEGVDVMVARVLHGAMQWPPGPDSRDTLP